MDRETLIKLEKLNQLALTEGQRETALGFFEGRHAAQRLLDGTDTSQVGRMVHVMPLANVLREDIEKKLFSREQLQRGAPETSDGCWRVPRLVE